MRRSRRAIASSVGLGILTSGLSSMPMHAQGGATISSLGEMAGWIRSQIQAFQPSKDGGRTSTEPYVRNETSTPTAGGRSVTRQSTYRIVTATDRDTITFIIDRTERYGVPGRTPGSAPVEVSDSGGVTLQVDTCPDEDGTITVTANASGTYDVTGEGLSFHATLDTRDTAVAQVDDRAELAGRRHDLSVRSSASRDGSDDSNLDLTLTWTGSDLDDAQATVTEADGVVARDLDNSIFGGVATAKLVDMAIDSAATVWRGGRCLELKVEPPGKNVDPGSETEITVKIEHKAFDEEVKRDIEATLEGTDKVEPPDTPVMAPATFTYTATSELKGDGRITFRSVSNRGIAEERTETYTVDLRLLLDAEGSVTSEVGGQTIRTTYRGRGLRVVLTPAEDPEAPPQVSIEGELILRGRVTTLYDDGSECRGRFRGSGRIDAGPGVSARIIGDPDDRRIAISLTAATPNATIDFQQRCRFPAPVGRISAPTSLFVSDLFPVWAGRSTPVELPLTGGTASDRRGTGSIRWESTLTLRTEEPEAAP